MAGIELQRLLRPAIAHPAESPAASYDRLSAWAGDLTALHELTGRLARTTELEQALHEILRAGAELLGARRGFAVLQPADGRGPDARVGYGIGAAELGAMETVPRASTSYGRILDAPAATRPTDVCRPDLAAEPDLHPRHRDVAMRLGYGAGYAVPLAATGAGAGAAGAGTGAVRAPGPAAPEGDGGPAGGAAAGQGRPGPGQPDQGGMAQPGQTGTGQRTPPGAAHPGTAQPEAGHPGAGHPGAEYPGAGHPNAGHAGYGAQGPAAPGPAQTDHNGQPDHGPAGPRPPAPGHPAPGLPHPHPGQPYAGQSPTGQPHAGQPYTGQSLPGQSGGTPGPVHPETPGPEPAGPPAYRTGARPAPAAAAPPALLGAVEWLYDGPARPTDRQRRIAGLYTRHAGDHLARLLDLARARTAADGVRAALLPARLPRVPGARVAVRHRTGPLGGGDFYDVLPLPDGALGLAVGSAGGGGPAAVAAMGQLRAGLRAYAVMEGEDPVAVLSDLELLMRLTEPGRRATALFAYAPPGRGSIVVAGAGHCPPLVTGPWRTEYAETTLSAPLGMLTCWEAPSVTIDPAPGETVLLYTDGLLHRTGRPTDQAMTRLHHAAATAPAPVRDDPEALTDHVLARLLPAGPHDGADHPEDVVLLAVQLTG
ncbi:SpoIIE family protein phosphatase [Streptomyces sp. NPDC004134]|uniref:GAF domain-containing SpoIIE family protein phosphatase n=1 Tax=Streptomyces sp. NPDC004134 TaxID=3364691 RepID=UPI0036A44948